MVQGFKIVIRSSFYFGYDPKFQKKVFYFDRIKIQKFEFSKTVCSVGYKRSHRAEKNRLHAITFEFFTRYNEDDDEFLSHIISGDETWK